MGGWGKEDKAIIFQAVNFQRSAESCQHCDTATPLVDNADRQLSTTIIKLLVTEPDFQQFRMYLKKKKNYTELIFIKNIRPHYHFKNFFESFKTK